MCSVSQSAYFQSREGEGGVLHFLTLNGLMDINLCLKLSLSIVSSIHPSTEDFWLLVENLHMCARVEIFGGNIYDKQPEILCRTSLSHFCMVTLRNLGKLTVLIC